jgi:hypothetical protein
MRLWHLVLSILLIATALALGRDPVGRTALIVFVTGLGEVVMGTTALLLLFQAIGAIGEARGLFAHAEAVAITSLVLVVAAVSMAVWLFAGTWLLKVAVA